MSDMPAIIELTVPEDAAGLRLDRFLAGAGRGWSRSQVPRWIEAGQVLRNGGPSKPAQLLQAGDVIEVSPPPPTPSVLLPQAIALDVLFEDEHVIVINKPPGLVIHPAAGNPDGTLVNALLAHCRDLSGVGGVERPGIVHRLDKDTSGVLVAAKSDQAHRALSLSFRWRTTDKRYLAVVYGDPGRSEGFVDAPIARSPSDRKRMAVVGQGGKAALTHWRVRERFAYCTLLEVSLATGRTHQIRVHLAAAGHPVFGDPTYGGRNSRLTGLPAGSTVQARHALERMPRQALHAARLSFRHPVSGLDLDFEAPLPGDIAETLAILRRPLREPAA